MGFVDTSDDGMSIDDPTSVAPRIAGFRGNVPAVDTVLRRISDVEKETKTVIQLLNADTVYGMEHLLAAIGAAARAARRGRDRAIHPKVEMVRYAAGEHQIGRALERMGIGRSGGGEERVAAVVWDAGDYALIAEGRAGAGPQESADDGAEPQTAAKGGAASQAPAGESQDVRGDDAGEMRTQDVGEEDVGEVGTQAAMNGRPGARAISPGGTEAALSLMAQRLGWTRDDSVLAGDESVLDAFGIAEQERRAVGRDNHLALILELVALADLRK